MFLVSTLLNTAFWLPTTLTQQLSAQNQKSVQVQKAPNIAFIQMTDGKLWTKQNLDIITAQSYCYEDADSNCSRYGRLYTWESARKACQSLGDGWRLPTDIDWRLLTKHYGGVSEDSEDKGKEAYQALLVGGNSGFNAELGGGRDEDGKYARLEAHGFYWTESGSDPSNVWYYNFGRGGSALHRQSGGEKQGAFSVRCFKVPHHKQ